MPSSDLFLVAVEREARHLVGLVEQAHRGEERFRLVTIQPAHGSEEIPAAPPVGEVGGLDVLEHRELREDIGALEGAAHAEPTEIVGGDARHLALVEAHAARVGAEVAGDEIEQRGLARAVGTDDGADRSTGHVEADAPHGEEAVEALAQSRDVKHAPSPCPSARGGP
jgi:hypothetical protein